MPRLANPAQLATFRKQQVELAKKIKAAEIKQRARDRTDDLRRSQVLGAAVLAYFAQPDQQRHRAKFLKVMFEGRTLRAADRALFKELMPTELGPVGTRHNDEPATR